MMRVEIECPNCGIAREEIRDSGIGDTEDSVLSQMDADEMLCKDCRALTEQLTK